MTSLVNLKLGHNFIEYDISRITSGTANNYMKEWVVSWMPANMKFVDLSHNRLRTLCLNPNTSQTGWQCTRVGLANFGNRYPALADFKLNNNNISGRLSLESISYNLVS